MKNEEIAEKIDIVIEGILDGRMTMYSIYDNLKKLKDEIVQQEYKIAE